MRKSTLIYISGVFLVLALWGLWQYGSEADVHIVDMNTSPLEVNEPGQLDIVLQNNGSKPVDVWLEVENAFVDSNGVAHSTLGLIIPSNSGDPWSAEYVSLEKPIHLLPGNNSVSLWIGYALQGEFPVKVKVVENGKSFDERTYMVSVRPPETPKNAYIKLEYEIESRNSSDLYKIYGYLINNGTGSARGMPVNLTVIDERTKKPVLASSGFYDIGEYDKTPLWTWPDYPYAVVEIAHGDPLGESYMPVKNVVVGRSEDHFLINVTSTWQGRTISAELSIPPKEESR